MGITYEIAKDPESFPTIPGHEDFRLGKTDNYGDVPRLRVLFEILDDERVLLSAIHVDEEEFYEAF